MCELVMTFRPLPIASVQIGDSSVQACHVREISPVVVVLLGFLGQIDVARRAGTFAIAGAEEKAVVAGRYVHLPQVFGWK
jgi:hypothetical protein